MFDLVSNSEMIQNMDKSMSLATKRMALIASNMANLDTPGYRTRDINFQAALKQELDRLDGNAMPLAQTQPGHLPIAPNTGIETLTGVGKPAWERNDGNDVSLDRETAALARTQGAYSLSAAFAQKELQKITQLIRDGAR